MSSEKKKPRRRRMPWIAIGAALVSTVGVALLIPTLVVGPAIVGGATASQPKAAFDAAAAPAWVKGIEAKLEGESAPWLDLAFAERVLKASGEAPDLESKTAALRSVGEAVDADPEAKGLVSVIVDAISVAGGETGVGAALAALGANPDTAACQQAFTDTLAGRFIAFDTGSARISAESARLLDALTGAALLCKAHGIEVGGHTDARGRDGANLRLSQARAEAVRAYLIERGADAESLTAVGYGSMRLLDASGTEEADAKNRRIEFTVLAK